MNKIRKIGATYFVLIALTASAPAIWAQPAGDMIRMSTPELIVTHSRDGDYSEYQAKGMPQTLYIKADNVAMYENSWITLPPMMVTTMLNAMRMGVVQGMAEQAPEQQDDFQMHNLPRVFSERFSWDGIVQISKSRGVTPTAEPTECPDANTGCTTSTTVTDDGSVQTVFYSDGRPVQVVMPGTTFNFEYGSFDMRRPPAW